MATLAEPEAWHLAGRCAIFRVALDSEPDEEDGQTLYDCRTADGVLRTVWFHGGQDGTRFEGFTEYRLTGASLCR